MLWKGSNDTKVQPVPENIVDDKNHAYTSPTSIGKNGKSYFKVNENVGEIANMKVQPEEHIESKDDETEEDAFDPFKPRKEAEVETYSAMQSITKSKAYKTIQKLNKSLFKAVDRSKEIIQQLIRLQTKEYERKGSLFMFVVQNDLAGLKQFLADAEDHFNDFNADKIYIENSIDPVGASIIHAAYLFKNYEMGRWLVENYPEQAFLPYSDYYDAAKYGELEISKADMPYTGQNILHTLIVHKNLIEVRWLLEFYDSHKHSVPYGLEILLKTSTTGTFFHNDGDFYCGSYPLHFAAGANSPELFDLILAYFTSVSTSNQGEQTAVNPKKLAPIAMSNDVDTAISIIGEVDEQSPFDEEEHKASPRVLGKLPTKKATAKDRFRTAAQVVENLLETQSPLDSTQENDGRQYSIHNILTHQKSGTFSHLVDKVQLHKKEEEFVSEAEKFRRIFLSKHSAQNLGSNALFMRDSYGNNCLHLCVIHRLTEMYDHIKKVAASILRQEIKTAYGDFLNKREENPHLKTIELKSLPSWDVVHDYNEREREKKEKEQIEKGIDPKANQSSFSFNFFGPKENTKTQIQLHATSSTGNSSQRDVVHSSYKVRNPVWKAYKKHFDNIVERYLPFYAAFSASRLKRQKLDEIVRKKRIDNGFYYGYTLRESPIFPPGDGSNKPVSQSSFKLWLEEVVQKKVEERFEWVLNERFHSPLTLTSAGMGDDDDKGTDAQEERERDTIQFIINQTKQFRWKYGPVTSNLLYLEGVEVPYDCRRFGLDKRYNSSKPLPPYADAEMFGVVEWICITNSDKSAKIPEVVEIIEEKWRKLGSQVFFYYFITWCILCFCITTIVSYGYVAPNPNPDSTIEMAITVIHVITLFIFVIITVIELPSILFFGFEYWGFLGRRIRGAARLNRILQTMAIILYFQICFYKLFEYQSNIDPYAPLPETSSNSTNTGGDSADPLGIYFVKSKQCQVILVIVVWLNMFYYMMGFEQTGPFVLTVANIVGSDVPYFCTFYVLILIAYSAALNALCMSTTAPEIQTDAGKYGAYLLFAGIFDLIQVTVNMGLPADSLYSASNVSAELLDLYNFVLTTFYIIVGLMFINLLIGMIGNTYNMYQEYNDALLIMEKYNIMCGLEMSICWFVKTEDRVTQYAIKVEHDHPTETAGKGGIRKSIKKSGSKASSKKSSNVPVEDTQFPLYAFEIVKNDDLWWLDSQMVNDKTDDNMTQTLLILDPQNDFHEGFGQPGDAGYIARGSLAVPGANDDSVRIHDFIMKNMDRIDNIVVTMDSHYTTHIAHKCFWKKGPNQVQAVAGVGAGVRAASERPLGTERRDSSSAPVPHHLPETPHHYKLPGPEPSNSSLAAASAFLQADAKPAKTDINAIAKLLSLDPLEKAHLPPLNAHAKVESTPLSTPHAALSPLHHMAESKDSTLVSVRERKLAINPRDVSGTIRRQVSTLENDPLNEESNHPPDFTVITHQDLLEKVWMPVNEEMYDWCLYYTKELEKQGKLKLTIWPNHCIIGTPGHAVVPRINEAIQHWAKERQRSVEYIMKGQNLKTEMYSALSADVEDPADPSTAFNARFMSKLRISDQIYVCGQAKSHVVKFTLLDILKHWHASVSKIYLLEDGCSCVQGFEKAGELFVDDMRKQGVTVLKCAEAFPEKTSKQETTCVKGSDGAYNIRVELN